MKYRAPFAQFMLLCLSCFILTNSCGKGGGNTPAPNPCSGITVNVTGTTTNPTAPGTANGSITVTASGGSGFTFNINGGAFQSSGTFSNLAEGSYVITAKNSNGCTGSANFTLTAPNPCAGVTITVTGTITNPTAPGATNGSINASASGSSGFTFSIDNGPFGASGNFTGLGAGLHVVVAKDGNGCTGSGNFTLTAPNPCTGITITVTGTTTNPTSPTANNGIISASATGSTGFTYSLNGGAFQPTGTFTGLGAGNFTVTAKDLNGCTGSANFSLTAPNPCAGVTISVTNTITHVIPCQSPSSGSITAAVTGGASPYTFSINGTNFQSSNVFSNLNAGTYPVTAKDANGCTGTTNATVNNLPAGPLFNQVKTLLQNNCVSCHNPSNANGGMDWTVDCNIVQFKDRIQARAVNGNPSPMPPTGLLSPAERAQITNWINAGGRYTD